MPKIYPEEFYYQRARTGQNYQTHSSSRISPDRYLQGRPDFFIGLSAVLEKKPKTLILADWTARFWPEKKTNDVCAALKQLLNERFDILIFQYGELESLTTENIQNLQEEYVLRAMYSSDPIDIIPVAAKTHHLSFDEIHLLDHHWVNYLIRPYSDKRIKSISVLDDARLFHSNTTKLSRPLEVKEIIADQYSNAGRQITTKLSAQFKGVPIRQVCRYLEWSTPLPTIDPQYIEELDILSLEPGDLPQLLNLLNQTPQLEVLYISKPLLKTDLFELLNAATQIKKIVAQAQSSIDFKGMPDLHYLETVDLYESRIHHLSFLLAAAPFLKKLNLALCQEFNDIENIRKHSSLEELDLTESKITQKQLFILLEAFPNLKTINLSLCDNLFYDTSLMKKLSSLTSINITSNVEPNFQEIKPGELIRVKTLILNELDTAPIYHASNLLALLKAAPHLHTLYLKDYKTQDQDFSLAPDSLPYLTELGWSWDKTHNPKLLSLFSIAAPHLKRLYMLHHLTNVSELKPNCFRYLNEFTLEGDNSCEAIHLDAFFKTAPNLKYINLSYSTILGSLKLPPNSLPSLRECVLDGTKLSQSSLDNLCEAAPLLHRDQLTGYVILATPLATQTLKAPDSVMIDASTALSSRDFNLSSLFSPIGHTKQIPPNYYRLHVFQSAEVNPEPCDIKDAFRIHKSGDLNLIPIPKADYCTLDGHCYSGVQGLDLDQSWQPLASLSPQEILYTFLPSSPVELQYSLRDNLYYVRTDSPKKINVRMIFSLFVPDEQFIAKFSSGTYDPDVALLPPPIQDKINEFLAYTDHGELSFEDTKEKKSGADYLQALIEQKKGACRHRAFVFMQWMSTQMPSYQTRFIYNQCHAFAEVKIKDRWIRCDLGGHPANIHLRSEDIPLIEDRPNQTSSTLSSESPLSVDCFTGLSDEDNDDNDTALKDHFAQLLETWDLPPTQSTSIDDFFWDCLNVDDKKYLIECDLEEEADALHLLLMDYCQRHHHPYYYIHSPDDLNCSADFLYRDADNRGSIRQGEGNPLYDFLKQSYREEMPPPILNINYGQFKHAERAKFNALLDDSRMADGIKLPASLVIIGLIHPNHAHPEPGADFYSRFGRHRSKVPQILNDTVASVPKIQQLVSTMEAASGGVTRPFSIDLYQSTDWKERLLGRWAPVGGYWHYQEGALQKALASGHASIEMRNAPWKDPDFCSFWRDALLSRRIMHAQRSIHLASDFRVTQSLGYAWDDLKTRFSLSDHLDADVKVLNPGCISDFFSHYQINPPHLELVPGLIEKARLTGVLRVIQTRTITDHAWAMLLQACIDYGVRLEVYPAPGVNLPAVLLSPQPQISRPLRHHQKTQLILSADPELTISELICAHPRHQIIDISECDISDLLTKTTINKSDGRFIFSQKPSALTQGLNEDKTVILKGHFSLDLADSLALLLIQRIITEASGTLILISDCLDYFPYLSYLTHQINKTSYDIALGGIVDSLEPYILNESLAQLKARRDFFESHEPGFDRENHPWRGYDHLTTESKDPGITIDFSTAQAYHSHRLDVVIRRFKTQPYVFLTGLSGVGKTTFVREILAKHLRAHLHQGESAIHAWASDTTPDTPILLFIDEANLSASDWTIFEGLFNPEPAILIDGEYHRLSPNHRVIFAGNPISIGGERKLASFFQRHGNAIVFEPMPASVLYFDLLEPLLKGTLLEAKLKPISDCLLKIYRFLCIRSERELLISPRELQMMAMLILSRSIADGHDKHAIALTKHVALEIARPLVPYQHLAEFDGLFKQDKLLAPIGHPPISTFFITPSRQPIINILHDYLLLAEQRPGFTQDMHRSAGLGGLILEGAPGIGKSEMVIALLLSRGYKHREGERCFYHLPASMDLDKKEHYLLEAFQAGAVVVMDEMNCSPPLEHLLNHLLMGQTSDGSPPRRAGFMIIGTQNPMSMAGRQPLSAALNRRLMTLQIPEYTPEEIRDILIHQGMEPDPAKALSEAYEEQLAFGKRQHLSPLPNFRDLMFVATQTLGRPSASLLSEQGFWAGHKKSKTSELGSSVSLSARENPDNDARDKRREVKRQAHCPS